MRGIPAKSVCDPSLQKVNGSSSMYIQPSIRFTVNSNIPLLQSLQRPAKQFRGIVSPDVKTSLIALTGITVDAPYGELNTIVPENVFSGL